MDDKKLANYTIRLGNEAQKEQHLRASYVSWHRGRSWEDFMEDQLQCVRGPDDGWANKGALQCFMLVRRDDYDGPIYAGCVTLRRKSFYKDPNSAEVKDTFSYGICSVVTPEQHRRNGFATHLLRLLHYQLGTTLPPFPTDKWGPAPPPLSAEDQAAIPPGIASTLWSDVGSVFYKQVTIGIDLPGWVVRDEDCQQIVWKLSPRVIDPSSAGKKWDWIYTHDLPSIGEILSKAARERMSLTPSSTPIWSADPASPGLLQYIPSRTMRPRSADWRTAYILDPCGIRLPAPEPGQEDAIVLFVASPLVIGRAVHITYIHNLKVEMLPALLEALDEVGAANELEEGWVWGISPQGALGKAWSALDGRVIKAGRRDEINGHLLGVAWYGDAGIRGEMADTPMWSWC